MQKQYFYELLNIKTLTRSTQKSIFQVFLRPLHEAIQYKAGQYIEIQYPDKSFQPFSIANAPNAAKKKDVVEFFIRCLEKDPFQHQFLNNLQKNKKACLIGPFGNCTAHIFIHQPSILLCGGVGFSQSKAIIEQLISEKHQSLLHLYWGAKYQNSFFLENLLLKWQSQLPQFKYTLVFSDATEFRKRTIYEAVQTDHPHLEHYCVLVSGPKEMAFSSQTKLLFRAGLPVNHLYSDWFS